MENWKACFAKGDWLPTEIYWPEARCVFSVVANAKVRVPAIVKSELNSNWLDLDEPQIQSSDKDKDELERVFTEFPAPFPMVSHDPLFYEDFHADIRNGRS